MARLPIPGSDDGSWGDILNSYLLQSLTADGSIKTGVVGSPQLADTAVTSAKLAPSAVTSSHLSAGSVTNSAITDGAIAQSKIANLSGDLAGKADTTHSHTLTDVTDAGTAASLNVGTIAGTVAAGDDSRLTGALQASGLDAATAALVGNSASATGSSLTSTFARKLAESQEFAIAEREAIGGRVLRRMASPPTTITSKGSGLTAAPTVSAGGSGYVVGDVITLAGGTSVVTAQVKVSAVSGGAVTAVTYYRGGIYTTTPSNPVAQGSTTGSGTGATFTASWSTNQGATVIERQSFTDPTNTAYFRFFGTTLTNISASGYYGNGVSNARHSIFEWSTNSQRVDIRLVGLNTSGVLYVDGEQVSASTVTTDASAAGYRYSLDFGSAAWRAFRWVAYNNGFGGIYIDGTATMGAPITVERPYAWSLGDSYEGAVGAANAASTHILTMAEALGLNLLSDGLSGSGWNSTSTSAPDARAAAALAGISQTPQYVFLDLGFNDAGGNMTTAATAFDATVAAIRAEYPSVTIICFGPATPVGATANLDLVRDMLIARCAANNVAFVDVRNWVNATNKVRYTGVDNTHPTAEGYVFLGALRAVKVRDWL